MQDFANFFWTEDQINDRLAKIMLDALDHVWRKAESQRVPLRTAAFMVACERGLYP